MFLLILKNRIIGYYLFGRYTACNLIGSANHYILIS